MEWTGRRLTRPARTLPNFCPQFRGTSKRFYRGDTLQAPRLTLSEVLANPTINCCTRKKILHYAFTSSTPKMSPVCLPNSTINAEYRTV